MTTRDRALIGGATARGWSEEGGLLTEDRLSKLGLRHVFTTRRLGNMKDPSRRRAVAAKLGLGEPLTLRQVHGVQIHLAREEAAGQDGDGWIIDSPRMCVAVYVADCVPLFLWSDDGKAAGVFHAGWRGAAAGMPQAAVGAFQERLGIAASRLCAATGPHIAACCYQVGAEFERYFPSSSLSRREGALYLDLGAEVRRQLLEVGLKPENLGAPAPCTASWAEDYFSFRRDKQDARMIGLLSLNQEVQ